ncbi:MAG: tetratricopeptide repeat protein, partial [Pseudomonadota bacterium]|nr:tetratricopeptide repeat protein [Pseudomonadota bacterium]
LGILLLALFANLAFRALKTDHRKAFIWTGVWLGLAALVRGNVLALAAFLLILILRRRGSAPLRNAATFVGAIGLVILPITIHNAVTSGDFVLTSYAGGFNAYIGNGRLATGRSYVFPPEITSNPALEEFDITHAAVKDSHRALSPAEVSAYWWHKTSAYVVAHPAHELEVLLNKLEAFWSNDEPYDNYDMDFIERHFATILSWPLSGFGLLAGLSVLALVAMPREQRGAGTFFVGMLLLYMLTLLPFYVTDRYRLSAVVFLLPLAGAALPSVLARWKERRADLLIIGAAAMTATVALTSWPAGRSAADEAFAWSTLCTLYEDEGMPLASILALNQALALSPHTVGADAWIKAADATDHLGRHAEAEQTLQKIASTYPGDGTIPYNLGRMKFEDGDLAAALSYFQKAIDLTPTFTLSYRGVAAVYSRYGERAQALEAVRKGLAIVPTDEKLLEILPQLQ